MSMMLKEFLLEIHSMLIDIIFVRILIKVLHIIKKIALILKVLFFEDLLQIDVITLHCMNLNQNKKVIFSF